MDLETDLEGNSSKVMDLFGSSCYINFCKTHTVHALFLLFLENFACLQVAKLMSESKGPV